MPLISPARLKQQLSCHQQLLVVAALLACRYGNGQYSSSIGFHHHSVNFSDADIIIALLYAL